MAKWGEGDPRWIVEERPDATNVNNWHWVEKNAVPWSRDRLTELLLKQSVEKGPIKVDFNEFKKLEGDATANNRKAKLIFLFEWQVEITFIATVAGSDIDYKGYIELPNFSDENEAHEIDININLESRGQHENEVRHIIANEGLSFIRNQIGIYMKELKEEFSKDLIKPQGAQAKPQVVVKEKTKIDTKAFTKATVISEETGYKRPEKPSSVKSLELTQAFKAPPERLFQILTEPDLIRVWAGSGSSFDPTPNGEFSYFGGTFSGVVTSMTKDDELALKFRLKKFPEQYYANVRFKLYDKGDSTDLKLEAEGVPENLWEEVNNGFSRYFLQSIGNAFNIGLKIF